MKVNSIRSTVVNQLVRVGFERGLGGAFIRKSDIVFLIDPGTSKKNGLFSISAGIWFNELSGPLPNRFWKFHIYGGLGCMIPDSSKSIDEIVSLGAITDNNEVISDATKFLALRINEMSSLDSIRTAYRQGCFNRCMIVREAQSFLGSS